MKTPNFISSSKFQKGVMPILFGLSFLWATYALASHRLLPFLFVMLALLSHLGRRFFRANWLPIAFEFLFLGSCFSPIDVYPFGDEGRPRMAELRVGLWMEAPEDGAIYGGCNVTGYEPKWLWVW